MDKICNYLCNFYSKLENYHIIKNNRNNITYYVRLSPEDLISCDTDNNIDIINYISENVHKYFYKYEYDIIFDYILPMITIKYHKHKFQIKFNKRHDGKLYWILIL